MYFIIWQMFAIKKLKKKKKMTIQQLMELYNMTIHELIEMIKLRGELIETEDNVFGIPNDRYVERAIILFENTYYVTYAILDNFADICYYESMDDYNREFQARNEYDKLLNKHDGAI
jgi:hypothetical protein